MLYRQWCLAMDTPKGVDGIRPLRRNVSAPHVKSVNCAARTGNFGDHGVPAAKILVDWTSCYPTMTALSGGDILQIGRHKLDGLQKVKIRTENDRGQHLKTTCGGRTCDT
jgi:hypothetical protein